MQKNIISLGGFVVFSVKKFIKLLILYLIVSAILIVCVLTIPNFKFQSYRTFKECFKSVSAKSWMFSFGVVIICSTVLGFSKNRWLSVIVSIIATFFVLLSVFECYAIVTSGQWSYSKTNLIENYLVLDNEKNTTDVSHFPKREELLNAETVDYYYFYDEYCGEFEVCLTLSYDESLFLTEKQNVLIKFQDKETITEKEILKIVETYFVYEEFDVTKKYIYINDSDKTIKYYAYVEWFQI